VAPGGTLVGQYFGRAGGPVEVRGFVPGYPAAPAAIFASQRTLWFGGRAFNETPGIPATGLDATWYFPWYDAAGSGGRNWVLVGNPSPTATVEVALRLAGSLRGTFPVAPGGVVARVLPGAVGGPLEVRATLAVSPTVAAPVYATQRVLWGESFSEIAGAPAAALSDNLWLPWYDSVVTAGQTWLLIGNPNAAPAAYTVAIAGQASADGTIPAGGNAVHLLPGVVGGPVEIRGFTPGNPAAPLPLYASQRVLQQGAFSEVLARPLW